jgi:hypothetical protein
VEAVEDLALALVAGFGHGVTAELERAIDAIGAAQTIAVLMLAGRYVSHALIVNALELQPPVPSIFAEPAHG